ncbi:MAG: 4-(cytidine 5'-diphospho)-2-C-methyl-D-erythritol kinase [Bacteroidales bacterium]|nr:4-(cytidine 5'-diphospho)-2-C-methyl-D-erythritol kinase [Bacteroidales bacterium]
MITNPNVKINLGLNVLRKREDGFHDLETLFVPYFGISDTLEIIVGDDFSRTSAVLFSRYGSSVPAVQGSIKPEGVFGVETEESVAPKLVQGMSEDGRLMITIAREEGVDWDPLKDLTAKAYMILAEDFALPPVKIFLEKTSPVGAGLGGGSADAAFALKMLNELCDLGLSEDRLAGYASRLGSDCAFFVYNRPMLGEGRGEILTEYEIKEIDWQSASEGYPGSVDGSQYDLQVITPSGISVSTKEAYSGIRPHLPEVPLKDALARPVEEWDGILMNDFEETVFAVHPELAAIKRSLYESGAIYASMSGSGSALFALYRKDIL